MMECPNCGSTIVTTLSVTTLFTYGTGSDAVELKVDVPFRRCFVCLFEYTNTEAEEGSSMKQNMVVTA